MSAHDLLRPLTTSHVPHVRRYPLTLTGRCAHVNDTLDTVIAEATANASQLTERLCNLEGPGGRVCPEDMRCFDVGFAPVFGLRNFDNFGHGSLVLLQVADAHGRAARRRPPLRSARPL